MPKQESAIGIGYTLLQTGALGKRIVDYYDSNDIISQKIYFETRNWCLVKPTTIRCFPVFFHLKKKNYIES